MKQYDTLNSLHETPCVLTIGTFDGVHRGHQSIFRRLRELAVDRPATVITFTNHPKSIIHPNEPSCRLTSLKQKKDLLEQFKINELYLIPFTKEISKQSPELFLSNLMRHLPFSHLILGHDARLGHAQTGDPTNLKILAQKLNFHLENLPPFKCNEQTVSSSAIRSLIASGDFQTTATFLGRSYAISGPVLPGAGKGRQLGFPTANLAASDWCLPPKGVYATEVILDNQAFTGLTNIGHAPTLSDDRDLMLETHILDHSHDLYGQQLTISFKQFIRAEKKFPSLEALQAQIQEDIKKVRTLS